MFEYEATGQVFICFLGNPADDNAMKQTHIVTVPAFLCDSVLKSHRKAKKLKKTTTKKQKQKKKTENSCILYIVNSDIIS